MGMISSGILVSIYDDYIGIDGIDQKPVAYFAKKAKKVQREH